MQTNSVMYRWRFIEEDFISTLPPAIMPIDYYMSLLHAQKGRIGFIDEVMAVYCRHPGSLWWNSESVDFFAKQCTEVFNFYYAVYKNITDCAQSYKSDTLIPMFNHFAYTLRECENQKNLLAMFEQHTLFVLEQYIRLLESRVQMSAHINSLSLENSSLNRQISELGNRVNDLDRQYQELNGRVAIRASRKLMSVRLFRGVYLLFKKVYKTVLGRQT